MWTNNMKTRNCRRCQGSGRELDSVACGAEMLALRQKEGVKQWVLANKMAFSKAYVSDLELGKRNWTPGLITLYKDCLSFCVKKAKG